MKEYFDTRIKSNMKITVNKDFILSVLLLFSIDFLLEYYYVSYVVGFYKNIGLSLDFVISKYIESKLWFVFFILLLYFIFKKSRFIYALYLFLLLLVYVPGHIIYSYSNGSRLVFYSVVTFFLISALSSTLKFKIKTLYLSDTVKYYILIIFAVILLIPIFIDFRFNIDTNVFTLKDIYDVRSTYKTNLTFLSSYSFGWLAKVIVPVILVYSLKRKNYLFVFSSLMILIYLFLVSGHKSVYFTPAVILFYYLFGKDYGKKIKITLIFLFLFLLLINIPDSFTNNHLIKSLFVRRVFFVPALLNEYYFDYFNHNYVYLSHSIFKNFIDYTNDLMPAHVIANVYFGRPEMSANNGLISDGFMNFGYFGVVLFSVIFSLVLALLNSIKFDSRYFGLFIFFILTFISSAFLTVFLTHGFWIVLLFAFIVLPENKQI